MSTLSLQHQQYLQQQQLLAAVKSAKRVDTRRSFYSTPSVQQYQKYQIPQYTQYLSQYKPGQEGNLISEIQIVNDDNSFQTVLDASNLGHVICLPKHSASIQISLETNEKCSASGHFTTTIPTRGESVQRSEPLQFSRSLQVNRALEGYICYFEIVVATKYEQHGVLLGFIRQ
jgi:hypothetical protein